MRVCAISFKDCWRGPEGRWYSDGGFPLQMSAVASLFDHMDLLVPVSAVRPGGSPLPRNSRIIPLPRPAGKDFRRKLWVAANAPRCLLRIGRSVRAADAVHVPLPGDLPFLGLLVAVALRKRVLARYGGSWEATSVTTLTNRVTRAFMRAFAGGRNVMLAAGDGDRPPAPRVGWLFSSALSEAEIRRLPGAAERGLACPPRLAYVGRLSPEKGLDNLILALNRLEARPAPELVLIGDGPERKRLELLAAEYRVPACFTGQLERTTLLEELGRADLCVQPSLTEGFSKAWIDAMASGLPVLASAVGAAPVVIGENGDRGWLVPPGDPAALAAALAKILRGPCDWASLRRRCREYAEAHTLERWAGRIGQICAQHWNCRLAEGKLVL